MTDEIPQWARERACELANAEGPSLAWAPQCVMEASSMRAFARYITSKEEAPVDPLKTIEDEIYESWLAGPGVGARDIIQAALRRGIELAAKP